MKKVIGNLVDEAAQYDVVVHGCNCFNTMGSGIAKFLRDRYPGVYEADTIAFMNDQVKMGAISTYHNEDIDTTFVNGYTQHDYRGRYKGAMDVNYDAVRDVMKNVKEHFSGKKIGLPLIGCGLAGGDWPTVETIIDEELEGEDVTLVRILPDYLRMEIADAVNEKYGTYVNWNRLVIGKAQDKEQTFYFDERVLGIQAGGLGGDKFHNFVNPMIVNLEPVKSCGISDAENILEIKIKDDYKSYC
jgi:O-acetyl-ADP-ribose deacetylase (regulator of RNase III)